MFFVVSGYLVTQSWLADPNAPRYIARRILRIFPALLFVICISAFVLGPAISNLPLSAYLTNPGLPGYLRNLYLFPVYNLPGVFSRNIYPIAVNGSLWSLPVEVSMYITLAILGLWPRLMAVRLVAAALVLGGLSLYELRGPGTALAHTAVIFGTDLRSALDTAPYFLIGASLYSLRNRMRPNIQIAMVLSAAALLVPPTSFYPELALYLVLPYAVVAFALAKPAAFWFTDRIGDLSYGTYLFGFPVQQLVIQQFATAHHPLWTFALALPPTLLLALVSWHFIERPMLAFKPKKPPAPEFQKFFAAGRPAAF
jgi:peptidoglycan/LPS O-acetylase OafA/YrhL